MEIGPKDSHVDQATTDRLNKAVQDATNRTGGEPYQKFNETRTFVYSGDYIDAPVMMHVTSGSTAKDYYLHANSLYSVQAVTDSTGQVVERYSYDAYGARRIVGSTSSTSAIGLSVGFTGLRHEGGLVFARNRYMSPSLGRWIGRDPLGYVDGPSLYCGYFAPNALDPNGTEIRSQFAIDKYLEDNAGTLIKTKPENDPCGFAYSQKLANAATEFTTVGGDSLEKEIIKGMLAEAYVFRIDGDSEESTLRNIKGQVAARIRIVNNAKASKMRFGTGKDKHTTHTVNPIPDMVTNPSAWYDSVNNENTVLDCQLVIVTIYAGSGSIHPPSRNRSVWIPGDWGYIQNFAYDKKTWGEGYLGENLVYMGSDSFWGFDFREGKEQSLKNWVDDMRGWKSKDSSDSGAPRIMATTLFPKEGLRENK